MFGAGLLLGHLLPAKPSTPCEEGLRISIYPRILWALARSPFVSQISEGLPGRDTAENSQGFGLGTDCLLDVHKGWEQDLLENSQVFGLAPCCLPGPLPEDSQGLDLVASCLRSYKFNVEERITWESSGLPCRPDVIFMKTQTPMGDRYRDQP